MVIYINTLCGLNTRVNMYIIVNVEAYKLCYVCVCVCMLIMRMHLMRIVASLRSQDVLMLCDGWLIMFNWLSIHCERWAPSSLLPGLVVQIWFTWFVWFATSIVTSPSPLTVIPFTKLTAAIETDSLLVFTPCVCAVAAATAAAAAHPIPLDIVPLTVPSALRVQVRPVRLRR